MIKRVEELETQMGKKYFFDATLRYQAVGNALSPTGDKKKADQQFELAIKNNPNYFAVRNIYAEARLKGNEDEFKKQVDYVIKGNPKSLPEIESEQIVEQRKAKKKTYTNKWSIKPAKNILSKSDVSDLEIVVIWILFFVLLLIITTFKSAFKLSLVDISQKRF
jgi:tetratricopeptide (TPR) repeat protein